MSDKLSEIEEDRAQGHWSQWQDDWLIDEVKRLRALLDHFGGADAVEERIRETEALIQSLAKREFDYFDSEAADNA